MSITEKELAEKLGDRYDLIANGTSGEDPMIFVARRAAELLGVTLAPEKPEPGTWHVTENGSPARVNWDESLHAYYPDGEFDIRHDDSNWPALEPARVVPEAEWEALQALSEDENAKESLTLERDQWKLKATERGDSLRSLNALRADEKRNPADDQYSPAEPPVLTEEEVRGLWNNVDPLGIDWDSRTPKACIKTVATVNAAIAKHGGARELPGRDEVRDAIKHSGGAFNMPSYDVDDITYHVMALLGGGGRDRTD